MTRHGRPTSLSHAPQRRSAMRSQDRKIRSESASPRMSRRTRSTGFGAGEAAGAG